MGLGGSSTGSTSQSGSGSGWTSSLGSSLSDSSAYSNTNPALYTWKDILPSWVSSAQSNLIPYLSGKSQTGLTPQEEQSTWGGILDTLQDTSTGASSELARTLATSGLSASSPAAAGAYGELASDKMTQASSAALDFAKTKIAAKDTALGNLITSLYSTAPSALGSTTASVQKSTSTSGNSALGENQTYSTGSGGGGGK